MIRREITTTIIILVLKIVETNAACYWNFGNPGTECLMYCINSNTTAVNKEIEDLYNGHSEDGKEDCRKNGIWLRLRTLPYPNNIIEPNWFTAAIKVFELEVFLNDVKRVSADAFNSNAFRTVKKLLFLNLSLELIQNRTFNGLDELEVIQIQGAGVVVDIEKGALDTLKELRKFTFEQSLISNAAISINGFTGSEPLSKLEYVKIRYNLTNSINSSTFIGLTNVKYLDLSQCQITSIEEHSFDPIANSIEELNLSGNRLTRIPDELFNTILLSINKKMILINGNSWHCDCALLHLRLIIQQYQDVFTVSSCFSPPGCRTILESNCFDECEIPSSTTTETLSTTSQISSVSTDIIYSTTKTSWATNESSLRTLIPAFYYLFIFITIISLFIS